LKPDGTGATWTAGITLHVTPPESRCQNPSVASRATEFGLPVCVCDSRGSVPSRSGSRTLVPLPSRPKRTASPSPSQRVRMPGEIRSSSIPFPASATCETRRDLDRVRRSGIHRQGRRRHRPVEPLPSSFSWGLPGRPEPRERLMPGSRALTPPAHPMCASRGFPSVIPRELVAEPPLSHTGMRAAEPQPGPDRGRRTRAVLSARRLPTTRSAVRTSADAGHGIRRELRRSRASPRRGFSPSCAEGPECTSAPPRKADI
jgi:hypothetical protein